MLRSIIIALVCITLYNNCAVAEADKSNALATNPYDKIWLMSDYYTLHGYSNESDAFLNYRPYYVTNLQGVDYVYLERIISNMFFEKKLIISILCVRF